jgi:putative phosphonate metabolism protein
VTARYAVFYAPAPQTPLWRFGSETIGYDAVTGTDLDQGTIPVADWHALTEEPRRYGFHATLKAPFSLRDGVAEADLLDAVAGFARARACFSVPHLQVASVGSFIALVPRERSPALDGLAADCVRAFDRFRAPLSAADRARRLKSRLSDRQIRHLEDWGYPHVFEDFRFHMTLSGPLPVDLLDAARTALAERYAPLAAGLPVEAISVFRQAERSQRFRVIGRFAFEG